ncbi:epoxyqueuosine reductase [mine drainage metagenome]|uniref:Epoxyqueuosine reductase n=1 Tax=mine drainage metagenome TaxID=410659 RepID=A0A1J5TYP5_9ZZZZ
MTSLRQALLELGFDTVGFARIDGSSPGADALRSWLDQGMQATMDWIARNADRRADPRLIVEGANLFVALGVNYAPAAPRNASAAWARYALYEDYHDTIKPALEAAGRALELHLEIGPGDYRYYVDTGPVLERSWATLAGIGYTGKNAMLISREYGNWLFLAGVIVRAPADMIASLVDDSPHLFPEGDRGVGRYCGSCTRCLDACPTHAFTGPGVVDARRCISFLTIENKGPIPEEFRPLIGNRIYGCDTCAEVCPWNRFAQASRSLLLHPRPEIASLTLEEILHLTPERFAEVYRRTPIKRIKLAGLLRNACVVAGNSGDTSLLPALEALAPHESPLVREHAAWAIARLRETEPETTTR